MGTEEIQGVLDAWGPSIDVECLSIQTDPPWGCGSRECSEREGGDCGLGSRPGDQAGP